MYTVQVNIWEALDSSPPGPREEGDGENMEGLVQHQRSVLSQSNSLTFSLSAEERQLQVIKLQILFFSQIRNSLIAFFGGFNCRENYLK